MSGGAIPSPISSAINAIRLVMPGACAPGVRQPLRTPVTVTGR